MRPILAWHFLDRSGRLRYGDGRQPKDREKIAHVGRLRMCGAGLHASLRARDAVSYAPGLTLCRVRVSGRIIEGEDKLVAEERTILWRADATEVLRRFVIWCADRAVPLSRSAIVISRFHDMERAARECSADRPFVLLETADRAAFLTQEVLVGRRRPYQAGDTADEDERRHAAYSAALRAECATQEKWLTTEFKKLNPRKRGS